MSIAEKLDKSLKERSYNEALRLLNDMPRLAKTDTPEGIARFAAVIGSDDAKLVSRFLQSGADGNAMHEGLRMASIAVKGMHFTSLKTLMQDKRVDVTLPDADGETPFHHAFADAALGLPSTCYKLLLRGCKDTGVSFNERPPLLIRALSSPTTPSDVVHDMVTHARDLSGRDPNGLTPLMLALIHHPGNEIPKMLLNKGADVFAQTPEGYDIFTLPDAGSLEAGRMGVRIYLESVDKEIRKFKKASSPLRINSALFSNDGASEFALSVCGAHRMEELFEPAWWARDRPKKKEGYQKVISDIVNREDWVHSIHCEYYSPETALKTAAQLRKHLPPHLTHLVPVTGMMRECETPREDSVLVSYMRAEQPKAQK